MGHKKSAAKRVRAGSAFTVYSYPLTVESAQKTEIKKLPGDLVPIRNGRAIRNGRVVRAGARA